VDLILNIIVFFVNVWAEQQSEELIMTVIVFLSNV